MTESNWLMLKCMWKYSHFQDEPFKEKTTTIHNTNNPEYNQTFLMNFNRKSRTLLRIFKGKNIKLEVWSKGYVLRISPCCRLVSFKSDYSKDTEELQLDIFRGFLRSDTLVGTATVKLADLMNHCVIHTAVDVNTLLNNLFENRFIISFLQLMDGRRPIGGKLEVKIRLRDPIIGKEVEQVQEKWTVLV